MYVDSLFYSLKVSVCVWHNDAFHMSYGRELDVLNIPYMHKRYETWMSSKAHSDRRSLGSCARIITKT